MMEYRIEHRERQRFLAVKRAFSTETSLDETGHSIPNFWAECLQNALISSMQALCPPGRKDLYGLCGPVKGGESHFYYGIGVKVEQEPDAAQRFLENSSYTVWEVPPADYAVFRCMGPDANCVGEAWDKFFKEFSPQTGYEQTDDTDYELYYENGEPGLFCELWVPVKKRTSLL